MKIAVLETGVPPEPLADEFGNYPDMFAELLGAGLRARDLRRPDRASCPDPAAHHAYLITGSPAGVYEPLPWIAPLMEFIRAAERREDGRRLLRSPGDGRGARRRGRSSRPRAGARACTATTSSIRSRGRTASATIAIPASHQDQVVRPAAEHRRGRRVGLHPVRRARLDRPAGDLLPVPPGILARLCQGADREALRPREPIPTRRSPRSMRPTTMRASRGWMRKLPQWRRTK